MLNGNNSAVKMMARCRWKDCGWFCPCDEDECVNVCYYD